MSDRSVLVVSSPRHQRGVAPEWLARIASGPIERGLATAVVALIGGAEGEPVSAAAGDAARESTTGQPVFDLASLSKLWTASLALRLDHLGVLRLSTELGELWPGGDERIAGRTLEELLRHRGGLQPWTPLYRRCRRRASVAPLLLGGDLLGARRGTYSDLGYVLWGLSAERALARPLRELLRRELLAPLGLRTRPRQDTVLLPCRLGNEREVELAAAQGIRVARSEPGSAGQVQDGNARFLGTPAGHAGVFGTAESVLALARQWLAPGGLWSAAAAEAALGGPGPFTLGWRRATRRGSGGAALSPGSYGHVGFTGGSIWVDPRRRRVLVLLAHRTAVSSDLVPDRRRFHARALAAGAAV